MLIEKKYLDLSAKVQYNIISHFSICLIVFAYLSHVDILYILASKNKCKLKKHLTTYHNRPETSMYKGIEVW